MVIVQERVKEMSKKTNLHTHPAVSIQKNAYAMASMDGENAEITMYGDIYEQQPTDWWGDPVEGQFITLSEFLDDLGQIASCKTITIRMNSYGGDAGVSNTIHNRLRELARNGTKITCVVDGVAMSGGSLIMCACDTVKVNPSSLIMIHKCWGFFWGGYNADELREAAGQYDAWDKAQIAIYKRKTGLTETVLSHMMSDTTYMTGREAVEKGFADELIEDAEPLDVAASADGRRLFVRGRTIHLAAGMFAPDSIPTVTSGEIAPDDAHTNPPAIVGNQEGGNKPMAKSVEELRKEYPDLTAQIEAEARASAAPPAASAAGTAPDVTAATAGNTADDAVKAERRRMQEIDALAPLYDADTINAAKYGENACTAQEMAYRAAVKAAQQGKSYVSALESDTQASGAQDVGSANGGEEPAGDLTPAQRMAKGRADAKAMLNPNQKEEK